MMTIRRTNKDDHTERTWVCEVTRGRGLDSRKHFANDPESAMREAFISIGRSAYIDSQEIEKAADPK